MATSPLTTFVNIISSPRDAFASMKEAPQIWPPLLVILVSWILLWNWYYNAVDFGWLLNHMVDIETYGKPEDQVKAISEGIGKLTPGGLAIISSFFVIFITLFFASLISLYLVIVSAIFDDEYRLKNWFSFVIWTSVPVLFTMVAMILNFVIAPDARIAPEQLNPMSLNRLFFHFELGHPLKTFADNLDLTALWVWGLMIYGYRQWTDKSWGISTVVILIPVVVIYGGWALIAWA